MPGKPIRVLIVDDHPGVREGIRNLLSTAGDIVVVGEGGNAAEAIEQFIVKNPDLVLLDVELPDLRGDLVLKQIHEMQPELKVLAISSYSEREYILRMMGYGAVGYITKDEAPGMLIDAIRTVINQGGTWFGPRALRSSHSAVLEHQALTAREMQILELLARDRAPDEVAIALGIGKAKVEKYLKLLMDKYEVESLAGLKLIAQFIVARRGSSMDTNT